MSKTRTLDLDFGTLEKSVRWLEESAEGSFSAELDRRLKKLSPEGADALLRCGAHAATRSVRHEGSGRVPHGLLALSSARSLMGELEAEGQKSVLRAALSEVFRDIRDPGFGPFRLLRFEEVAAQGKEGTLFSFLEAVRAGETDWADHRFAWLVRNLDKEQVVDLLLSSALEGVTGGAHKVIGVVEVVSLLQGLGWEWAPIWCRPVVRYQASGTGGLTEYDQCRELVAQHDLLRRARRRPPGQPSWGERDAAGFFEQAVLWAEAAPPERALLVSRALTQGVGLEDAGDLIAISAVLLFLQETLRHPETVQVHEETDQRVHLLTAVLAMRQLVRLGTPGQRILGLLLAGWVPPVRGILLDSRAPDCAWWLPPVSHLREGSPAAPGGESETHAPAHLREMVLGGQANGLLPALTTHLHKGGGLSGMVPLLAGLAPEMPQLTALAMKFERAMGDAYRTGRTPHRWLLLWASALAFSLWPRSEPSAAAETDHLQVEEGEATLSP